MKTIPVTCAIIFHQGKVLVAQRSLNMDLPGKWEFPGGKIEESEDPKVCLSREIKEELSIEIEIFETLKPSEFTYPTKTIRLIPFVATWKSGEIDLLEHEQIVWLGEKELFCVDWAEADVPIVHDLQEKWVKLVTQIKTAK
ncbi:(deoxy)nucleoside triphosphate pyrophosphohydrolase [Algoriphagus sp.]|uniref:(deoxy)nucleoside triphosphate pyrophosphohydrolase n=1 Tax=Algoriphagus sp. TaxID=1872435 RepID=UPI0027174D9F|nr:(deoxy)nucleoside triphosphate pyrophosphohydrolase [Algoriphagus sp.]MDO8969006.1 (deoxy)nucleoside triphosphate pyrophosphohydrolase [Algoriphagus sp.]MDP3200236.1 (deoxy)nucleoside triphosphate pyrophosphohydrolase [Algoriphagus sp.]